ncbi:hypothetical protein PVAP13_3NG169600 [Panicum virgatum]|uniref:Uncharacterized protein n=1 Tax=Panicum virgatum TaxID=38727 RepID=A0A8T0U7D0_PANVG|nr:hypothetical protein PVAP13_3NG169600 [Panicum virgatum]
MLRSAQVAQLLLSAQPLPGPPAVARLPPDPPPAHPRARTAARVLDGATRPPPHAHPTSTSTSTSYTSTRTGPHICCSSHARAGLVGFLLSREFRPRRQERGVGAGGTRRGGGGWDGDLRGGGDGSPPARSIDPPVARASSEGGIGRICAEEGEDRGAAALGREDGGEVQRSICATAAVDRVIPAASRAVQHCRCLASQSSHSSFAIIGRRTERRSQSSALPVACRPSERRRREGP